MIHPCPIKSSCIPSSQFLGEDTPFQNITAEAPDVDLFLGSNFGWGLNVPRLGWQFTDTDGPAWCRGTTQQIADDCAAVQQLGGGGGNSGQLGTWLNQNGHPIPVFFNQQISCAATCPDGTQFVWTIAAGTFMAMDQATANAIAQSRACRLAFSNKICLSGGVFPVVCVGSNTSIPFSATGGALPLSFQIVSGSLPPGMSVVQTSPSTGAFAGTPSSAGNFTFMLAAVDANGNFMNKQYTISVFGPLFNPVSGTVGTAYTFQFSVASGVAPFNFILQSGALPTGLSLSSSGLVTGTPTTQQSTTAVMLVSDSAGNNCVVAAPFTINAAPCGGSTDWINSPGNCRVRIHAYVDGLFVNNGGGVCNNATPSAGSVWDGTYSQFAPGLATYYISNSFLTISGLSLANAQSNSALSYSAGITTWTLTVEVLRNPGAPLGFWAGTLVSTSPIGTYTFFSGCSVNTPPTLTTEAYSL